MRLLGARRRDEAAERLRVPVLRRDRLDGAACRDLADAGHELEDAVPAHLVTRVLEHAQEGEHVLHVRGLEELEPAPLLERDVARGELHLEVGAHVAGAEEHRHLAQRRALLVELEDPVDHEARLLRFVLRGHEPGLLAAHALGEQLLGEPLLGARDERVGGVEDGLRGAVVLLERHDGRARELAREVEDVADRRAAEGVDALRVVADDRDVAVHAAHPLEDARLEDVGVLVLVDEDVVVERADPVADCAGGLGLEQHRPVEQEVVVVDEVP